MLTVQEQAEEIYKHYPLKVARPVAIRAIAKQLRRYPFDILLGRTIQYSEIRKGDVRYVPYPATWFNQERFNDDPSTWRSGLEEKSTPKINPMVF